MPNWEDVKFLSVLFFIIVAATCLGTVMGMTIAKILGGE